MTNTKALRFWLAATLLASPLLAAKVENPRCEPFEVGTEATLEEAAASIAECPVERALVVLDGEIVDASVGTRDASIFPKPPKGAVVVHNHPNGNLRGHTNDRCAAGKMSGLYVVIPDGALGRVDPLVNPSVCQRLQAKNLRFSR